jgi:nucleoside triphosphate diphosphatase
VPIPPAVRLYPMQPSRDISQLIEITAALPRPGTTCGWDIEQTIETIVPNLARNVKTDPEASIRRANAKFERRFRFIEDALAAKGMAPGGAALGAMETL